MSRLSIMILCGRSPRHLYVANCLCATGNALAIVQERGRRWDRETLVKNVAPGNLVRKAWRWLRDRPRYFGGGEARFFFGDAQPTLTHQDVVVTVPHIDHPDVVALADRLRPDVIAVFGTSLIRGPLLSRGRLGIFNLHGGLSPRYRGADCTFWALYNGEPDQVGCTLHRIDAGIDTGNLVAHIRPAVQGGDDELTLLWRAVRDSAGAYAELLERLQQGDRLGQPQRDKGTLYQIRQRGWRAERQLAQRLRDGMLREVRLPGRIEWFGAANDAGSVRALTEMVGK